MENKINLNIKTKYLKNLNFDLYQQVWDLTAQVPKGRVTTYGAIARALGDIRASRAVGLIEHLNPRPIIVPCHRVVYSTGGLGGFGATGGVKKKIELLAGEGVEVRDGKVVNFAEIKFEKFSITEPAPLEVLRAEQSKLRNKIVLRDQIPINRIRTIAGIDVSYLDDIGFGAIVIMDFKTFEVLETRSVKVKIRFPYIPIYLSYHELPVAIELLKKLSKTNAPDLIIFDGNGVLHPLGLGLATHAGIILHTPTIGIAKKLLCGDIVTSSHIRGDDGNVSKIMLNDQHIGYGFKPKSAKTRSVYISPGNLISFETSLKIAKKVCKNRIPLPIQLAHNLALEIRRDYEKGLK